MANKTEEIPFFKKNRIAIVSVLAFVVAMCCIFAFAGSNSVESTISSEPSFEESAEAIVQPALLSGYGIYVDGYFVAAAETEEAAAAFIKTALDARVSELKISSDSKNSFNNSISFVKGEYIEDAYIKNISSCFSEKVTDYKGELLPVTLSVKSVKTYSENVVIQHSTKTIYTDGMKNGATDVATEGFDGEGIQTYEIVSVDGVEKERNVVSLEVTTQVIDEVVYVGTRSDGITVAAVKNFLEPYKPDRCIITSYMGPRWGTVHKGIDIARDGGCYGDPAYAACDGVVIKASDSGNGYGKCVIIDHGDGITTLYAHFSKLSVEVGDIVKAGDEVGKIGSTGYSFGPHLHFEVRIDDVPVNPLMFLDYDDINQ